MKGRHLRHSLRDDASCSSAKSRVACDHIAGLDEGVGAGVPRSHALMTQAREDVDVELVVCEDYKILEVLRVGAGVVKKPVQRIINSSRTEQSERFRCSGQSRERAIGDRIVHGGEIRRVEHVTHGAVDAWVSTFRARRYNIDVAAISEMDWDRFARLADFDWNPVVLDQELDLFRKISAEEVGPRYGRRVDARPSDEAVGKA